MNNYEQKYKDALERAKAMIKVAANQDEAIGFVNTIFPELAESEDEKIRKTLIEYFNAYPKDYYGELKKSYILAWLEKQGTSYTKRDIDDAYIKGMSDAKRELEKQGEKKCIDDLTQQEAMDIAVAKCFEQGGQKPTWNEEDEVRLQACIDTLQAKSIMGKVDTINTNWLKSLKERIGG